jgi:hypothetical protein
MDNRLGRKLARHALETSKFSMTSTYVQNDVLASNRSKHIATKVTAQAMTQATGILKGSYAGLKICGYHAPNALRESGNVGCKQQVWSLVLNDLLNVADPDNIIDEEHIVELECREQCDGPVQPAQL